jgi:RND family efflux transporter MFP subunit
MVIALLIAGLMTFQQLTALPSVSTALVLRQSPIADQEITTANGYLVARTRASVASKVQGRLASVLVDEGDQVKSGQLLAEVEHEELDAQVLEAEANLAAIKEQVPERQAILSESIAAEATAKAILKEKQAAVEEAEAIFKESQASFERTEYLFNKKIRGDADLDTARQARDVAKARVNFARTALLTAESRVTRESAAIEVVKQSLVKATHEIAAADGVVQRVRAARDKAFIRSPFAGMVLRREAEPGEVVSPANTGASGSKTAVVTLADFATLEIEVDVYERDIARITEGTLCRVVLDAYPDRPQAGKVRLLRPTADRTKATIQVYVVFNLVPDFARPEMGARVSFYQRDVNVLLPDHLLIPAAAITEREGSQGVFVLTADKLGFRPVETAVHDEEQLRVLKGLDPGESVVLSPAAELSDGAQVQVESE